MTVSVEAWMLATAFVAGFITGAAAAMYWFVHGFVMGAVERLEALE
ncbi:hypothetical protein [Halostella salina]|nr:hypothetical protein [Halostella salina]